MCNSLIITVPCYNEEATIGPFLEAVESVFWTIEKRAAWSRPAIVFVDDGSSDDTLRIIKKAATASEGIHYISFSRNFGKEAALLAGIKKSLALGATHLAVMDVDLQDPPCLLPKMIALLESRGCDVVAACRTTRNGEPPVRSWFARRFYDLMNKISDVEMMNGARDFRIMTRRVAEAIVEMPENQRFSKGIFAWVGFDVEWLQYENTERSAGQTHWSFLHLVGYALDGIVAFSTFPLVAISLLGVFVSFIALLTLLFIFFRALLFSDPVAGWPSLVCIVLLMSGVQILSIGVVGTYLSKVYSEVKRRPMYVVMEESSYSNGHTTT